MIPSLNLLPKEFQNRELFKLIGPLLDRVSCELIREQRAFIKAEGNIDKFEEYIAKVHSVFSQTTLYVEGEDYIIVGDELHWLVSPNISEFTVDFDFYRFCSPTSTSTQSEPLLDKILSNYSDITAVVAYFRKMIKPTLGTTYCVKNLMRLLNLDAFIYEWYQTTYLRQFKFAIRLEENVEVNIKDLIDLIFAIKNERSHLAKIGDDSCRVPEPWDTFYFDVAQWDDLEGVMYRGVKICRNAHYGYTLSIVVNTNFGWYQDFESLFYYSNLPARWVGAWDDRPWDSSLQPESTSSHYYIDLYPDYTESYRVYTKPDPLVPSTTLTPSSILTPMGSFRGVQSIVKEDSTYTVTSLGEGGIVLPGKIVVTQTSELYVNLQVTSAINFDARVLILDYLNLEIVVYDEILGVTGGTTHDYIHLYKDLSPGEYAISIVNLLDSGVTPSVTSITVVDINVKTYL